MSDTQPTPRGVNRGPLLVAALFGVLTVVALLATLGSGLRGGAHAFHGTTYPDAEAAPPFTLTDHRGEALSLADLRGEAVLLFFGFTHCPDVCPLTLQRLGEVIDGMGARGDDVRVALVSVDPERDTPEVLARYVEAFGPRVIGLTGDPAELEALRRSYGVYAGPQPGPNAGHDDHGMIVHTTAVFGIDRAGVLRVLLNLDMPEADLRSDIAALLR